jgi:hypothetical protein
VVFHRCATVSGLRYIRPAEILGGEKQRHAGDRCDRIRHTVPVSGIAAPVTPLGSITLPGTNTKSRNAEGVVNRYIESALEELEWTA